ncbi:39S ribosomal protein L19, mitochondrial, partial [Fragariocoptes setiger]
MNINRVWRLNGVRCNHLKRYSSTQPTEILDVSSSPDQKSNDGDSKPSQSDGPLRRRSFRESILPKDWQAMRFKYPEFLPDISDELRRRNKVKEKLERMDMLRRRTVIEIPEFYIGSIMAVTVSDPYANEKVNRFLGICIHREGQGLYANFTLRNHIDGFGVEVRYDMYNPTIRSVEVIKLEKRLDTHLLYLRDALPEYSTFPTDMRPVPLEEGSEVPVNKTRVIMKPLPWSHHWERYDFYGIEKMENIPKYLYEIYRSGKKNYHKYFKYDTMIHYREHVPEEDQYEIWKEMAEHEKNVGESRKAERYKKLMQEQLNKKYT